MLVIVLVLVDLHASISYRPPLTTKLHRRPRKPDLTLAASLACSITCSTACGVFASNPNHLRDTRHVNDDGREHRLSLFGDLATACI